MVKVSVIIPNYNHASFLVERIDSVLNQTFQDFEILILDDASTDSSLEILNDYKQHPKVTHFIVNEINSGSPFKQWRKGIELAKGNYIWIAETDDFAASTFLEKTVEVLDDNLNTTLVYTDSFIVNSNGDPVSISSKRKNTFFKTQRWLKDYKNEGKDEVLNYILYKVTINNASAALFRKKQLLEIDLDLLTSYKNVGDMFAYCSVLCKGDVNYIAQPLNSYRSHPLNVTKVNLNSGLFYIDALKGFEDILRILKSSPLNEQQRNALQKVYKSIINRFGFSLVDNGFHMNLKKFIKQLSKNMLLTQAETRSLLLGFKMYKIQNAKSQKIFKIILKRYLR